ncbi:hypothetical protein GCM10020255_107000 [Rhodococcus baikonurensis]
MGRAIVRHPKVFCMDEPLSNLDAKLRVSTRSQIAALQRRLGTTTVYVTHDQVEAMTMGDRVAVMLDGRLQQVAKPRDLYDNPVNTFVAAFIGSPGMNLIEAPVEGAVAVLGDLRIPLPTGASERDRVVVGVRPESWDLVGAWRKGSLAVDADLLEELGAESFVYAKGTPDCQWQSRSGRIVIRVDRKMSVAPGSRFICCPRPARCTSSPQRPGYVCSDTVCGMTVARSLLLFVLAALLEIGGAWLVWQEFANKRDGSG